ncbi:hypothetical protein DV737_g400, partial [Chaetothyriales sp. CBS 132003]
MPLIPNTMNPATSGATTEQWMQKLLGKTIGDSHSELSFAKSDLPSNHRVLEPGSVATTDFQPARLNIHTDESGVVKKITHG